MLSKIHANWFSSGRIWRGRANDLLHSLSIVTDDGYVSSLITDGDQVLVFF